MSELSTQQEPFTQTQRLRRPTRLWSSVQKLAGTNEPRRGLLDGRELSRSIHRPLTRSQTVLTW